MSSPAIHTRFLLAALDTRTMSTRTCRGLLLLAILLVSACSSSGGGQSGSAAAASTTVAMNDANQYVPATLTVQRGGTVVWSNTGSVPHTVTDDPSKASNPSDAVLPAGAQPWDSGTITGGQSYSRTFDVAGQYTYFCIPHEALGMVARITVNG